MCSLNHAAWYEGAHFWSAGVGFAGALHTHRANQKNPQKSTRVKSLSNNRAERSFWTSSQHPLRIGLYLETIGRNVSLPLRIGLYEMTLANNVFLTLQGGVSK